MLLSNATVPSPVYDSATPLVQLATSGSFGSSGGNEGGGKRKLGRVASGEDDPPLKVSVSKRVRQLISTHIHLSKDWSSDTMRITLAALISSSNFTARCL